MSNTQSLPTTLVSGYLGSGKSTFINRLLTDTNGQRITVLVNDFGEIAIDEELIANQDGDTLALTNGCMCCSIGGALFDAIDKILRSNPKPDHLVIETSGVADPGKIAQIAIAEPELAFTGCFTLVDAVNFRDQLKAKYISDTVQRQVQKSDVIGISKSDLAGTSELETLQQEVSKLNCDATTVFIERGNLPFEFLLEKFSGARNSALLLDQQHSEQKFHHHKLYESWSYEGNDMCTVEDLRNLSEPSFSGVYRMKGYLKTSDGTHYLIHRVGNHFEHSPSEHPNKNTRLVAIGPAKAFSPDRFDEIWRDCVISADNSRVAS